MIAARLQKPQSLSSFVAEQWAAGLDTYAIAAAATAAFGHSINEAVVARLLARWRDEKARAV